jgi:hypothetical protein
MKRNLNSNRAPEIEAPDTILDECPEMGFPTFEPGNLEKPIIDPRRVTRRSFLRRTAETGFALGAADFLGYLMAHGDPNQGAAWAKEVGGAAKQATEPNYLIYWFVEGGWESYDMFSPVDTPNNIYQRLPMNEISKERYRVLNWGKPGKTISQHGNIRYGYLAEGGKNLFPEMAVLSSMHTGSFHSGERLKAHMGSYDLRLQADREPDERSVMQAFAEVHGQPYVLPHLSWHWWLSDGELNEVQYTGRKGYYHALGPSHAHTIYGGTPGNLRDFLLRMQASASDVVNREIEKFLDDAHTRLVKDKDIEVVKSYNSARQIYENLNANGKKLNRGQLSQLFTNAELKAKFKITPADELITYRSVNGNKARTKFAPSTNVQAMMAYEMMRANLSCAFFIETRDIRQFDSHYGRQNLWEKDGVTPKGQPDQTQMMNAQIWDPLNTLVDLLKTTPHPVTNKPLWEYTTIVLTSEFGRTIHGDVDTIIKSDIPEVDKKKAIDGQDISEHWKVTSAAFLGPKVNGNTQWGAVGNATINAIPLLPDGSMTPDFDHVTGLGPKDWDQNPVLKAKYNAMIPNHGDVNATALALCGISPKDQKGRNDRKPLEFIKKKTA